MLSKEYRTIFGGAAVVVVVGTVLNLLFKFDIVLSLSVGIILGIIIGLIINSFGGK